MFSTAFEPPKARRKKKPPGGTSSSSSSDEYDAKQRLVKGPPPGARRKVPGSGSSRGSGSESNINSLTSDFSRSTLASRAASVPSTISTQHSNGVGNAGGARRSFSNNNVPGSGPGPGQPRAGGSTSSYHSAPRSMSMRQREQKEEEAKKEIEQILQDQSAITAVCSWLVED